MAPTNKTKDKKVDASVDMTFPASDAPVHATPTRTEAPRRPAE